MGKKVDTIEYKQDFLKSSNKEVMTGETKVQL